MGVKALVVHEGRLLLVREADGDRLWELPGGRIEVGEEALPLEVVLRRELDEELGPGFDVTIGRPVAIWVRPSDPPRRTVPVFLVGLACQNPRGEVVLSGEHVEHAWLTPDECALLALAPGYAEPLRRFWADYRRW